MAGNKKPYLSVYDYGMGGVWPRIYARSPEEITRKYPELVVVEEWPPWLTQEWYDEIVSRQSFDVDDEPSGWLAVLANASSRFPSVHSEYSQYHWYEKPPDSLESRALGKIKVRYVRTDWHCTRSDEPVRIYSEIDERALEVRKVEEFVDGKLEYSDGKTSSGTTKLATLPIPSFAEIRASGELTPTEISPMEFETLWLRATSERSGGSVK